MAGIFKSRQYFRLPHLEIKRAVLALLFGVAILLGLQPLGRATADSSLGFLEVCKATVGEGVTGTFSFSVAGQRSEFRPEPVQLPCRSKPATSPSPKLLSQG